MGIREASKAYEQAEICVRKFGDKLKDSKRPCHKPQLP
jgi:hypothetical protein